MKKLLLCVAVAVFGFTNVNAQDFNVGINGGLPMGDVEDFYTLNIGVDINYLWDVSDEFQAGASVGYSHFLGDSMNILGISIDFEDVGFLPVAAAARYNVSDQITLGADLGYAVGISPDGMDGGVYYAPKAQYGVSDTIDIVLAYKGISVDGGTFSSLNLGVEFGF